MVNHLLEIGSHGARAHIQVLLLRQRRSALRQPHFQLHKHVSLEPVSGTYSKLGTAQPTVRPRPETSQFPRHPARLGLSQSVAVSVSLRV